MAHILSLRGLLQSSAATDEEPSFELSVLLLELTVAAPLIIGVIHFTVSRASSFPLYTRANTTRPSTDPLPFIWINLNSMDKKEGCKGCPSRIFGMYASSYALP
jgi:hypothetical protein